MNPMPLRYNISNVRQLTGCLSNNSRDLHIHVTEFYNQFPFRGLRISVDHDVLGTLFAYTIGARGDIVTDYGQEQDKHEFAISEILSEIEKYGFFVTYNPRENLKGDQVEYLMTVNGLGYDKIRVIHTWEAPLGVKEYKWHVVAFKSKYHTKWLNNTYQPSTKEFQDSLLEGTAMNISAICKSKKFRWDWLDYVANINDIVLDNAGDDHVSEYYRS